MTIYRMATSPIETNTYILDAGRGRCAVVDPGGSPKEIQAFAADKGLTLAAVLLTHAHFDHAGAAAELQRKGAKIYLHESDLPLIRTDMNMGRAFGWPLEPFEPDVLLRDGDRFTVGETEFMTIHTPGHTAGSVCFLVEQPGRDLLLSGDTLFYLSAGRTDFPTGNARQMLRSLRETLFLRGKDCDVYPGHDRATTLFFEKEHNPYAARHR